MEISLEEGVDTLFISNKYSKVYYRRNNEDIITLSFNELPKEFIQHIDKIKELVNDLNNKKGV